MYVKNSNPYICVLVTNSRWHEKIQPSDDNVDVRNKHAKCNQSMWYKIIHLGHPKNGKNIGSRKP